MADAVVSVVINKAVDIGANMIFGESLREDVGWLERKMRRMQGYLVNAEAKKSTNPIVVNLIKDIRELVYDVEDIFDTHLPQIRSQRSNGLLQRITRFLPYDRTSFVLSRKIQQIKTRVEEINALMTQHGAAEDFFGTDDVPNANPRINKLHVDDPIIVGFQRRIILLKSKLREHPFVSIVGMAGIGKTTLAKKVFKGIKDDFDCYASISVSQKPNLKSLMQDIAKQVGVGQTDENLEVNLYSFLQGKRYVVFLDDIWDVQAWDSLKGCFPIDSESASRIIITSRYTGVGRYIGAENSLHQLDPLDYPTSWELFSRLIDIPFSVEMIGKQIVEKCGGVPLAIVIIVGMLRERGMSEFSWNEVLHSMGENASDECSQILSLSYRDLPTSLKPCFLYFGIFPEDYEFSASKIIRLWIAEKFIPRVRGDREPEDVGAGYISTLEARNLIQVASLGPDGRVKVFRIHDLLHNLCVNVGREINFLSTIDRLEASSAKRVRRLTGDQQSVAGNEKVIHEMTKLRALFHVKFVDEIEIKCLNDMLGRFKLLHSLILEFEHVCVPSQIERLSRLNYLEIQSTGSVTLPRSIQNLKNLQTLDVEECYHLKLPIGIWEMEQLRHLLLRNNYEIDSNVMYQQEVQVLLPNLQTLVRIKCSDLKPTWLPKFTNLRKLGLDRVTPEIMEILCGPEPISKKLETLSFRGGTMTKGLSLAKYGRLMKLNIMSVKLQMQQPLELPPNLINLTLHTTELNKDPMKILKNLPKLKFLNLFSYSYLGSKMDCSGADNFPQLEILRLIGLFNLEELIEGEEMGMPKLRDLIILGCDRLVRIPERLQQLKNNYSSSAAIN